MLQDVRFGLRLLARNPGLTSMAKLALTLCIGGSTVTESMILGVCGGTAGLTLAVSSLSVEVIQV
jgi:hypothetical protein